MVDYANIFGYLLIYSLLWVGFCAGECVQLLWTGEKSAFPSLHWTEQIWWIAIA